MIIVIDNYDSFTYNLVQYLGEMGHELRVFRNNRVTLEEIATQKPSHIIISPGPGAPQDAGISEKVVQAFHKTIPILGVCLGHQAIGEVFGGKIVRAPSLMHGKTSPIFHDSNTVFRGLPQGFPATRYHSLVVTDIPACLEVSAQTQEGVVMGLRHRDYPTEGIQFHPESIMTVVGKQILANFMERE
jgi:anthranilate synthase/aminodeoxychorismate synthase-like glutamine amidotransferase